MVDHQPIIKRFGSIRALARALGHESHTTVQGWWDRKSIPIQHWNAVADAAKANGVPFDMTELMPVAA